VIPAVTWRAVNSEAGTGSGGEATLKACGVGVARLPG
jgi:hypothetical protein